MFYKIELEDHIRIPPSMFGLDIKEAIKRKIRDVFDGFISKDLGLVIDVVDVNEISDGVVIPGDGAYYYKTTFSIITFRPELHDVVIGKIRDIADFGAFMNIGPIDGMIHISQTMDDFVSFSKDKVLLGKETKQSLKVGDVCKGKIIAISYKDITNPKIGLTMRSKGLGKLEWLDEKVAAKAKE